jgi:16S rRNA (guanine966-N2)-methyltransferase
MRIIGGKNQRRQITAPARLPVRPTTDMAKEALFNILNNHYDFEAINVLDLFSGTGNISYEFASRGAIEVISIDINLPCVQFIRQTAENLDMPMLKAVKADAFHFLSFCKTHFDIIFADPPYDMERISEIPDAVFKAGILKPDGLLIIEHGERVRFSAHNNYVESRHYGKVHFSFFKNDTDESESSEG